jgi:hypothetical protein
MNSVLREDLQRLRKTAKRVVELTNQKQCYTQGNKERILRAQKQFELLIKDLEAA